MAALARAVGCRKCAPPRIAVGQDDLLRSNAEIEMAPLGGPIPTARRGEQNDAASRLLQRPHRPRHSCLRNLRR